MYKGKLYVFFLSTFLQNSPQNSKIPAKIAATANKKIQANMTEWRYSQLRFNEKKSFLQAFLLQSQRMLQRHILAIWRPKFQKFSLHCPPWGYLMETVN